MTRPSKIAPKWVGLGLGAALVAVLAGVMLFRPHDQRVSIGQHDEIYYYRRATKWDALALGDALRKIGFFNDRGTSVLLRIGGGPTIVSFVVSDGAWDRPNVVSNYTEIGRRVAPSLGGFPMVVHLTDAHRVVRREMMVGKATIGARDTVYYFGSATLDDANTLGAALRKAGYFTDAGFTVALLKGEGTILSFMVRDGVWDNLAAVATLDRLTRHVAPAIGGLPVTLRLVDSGMNIRQQTIVQ